MLLRLFFVLAYQIALLVRAQVQQTTIETRSPLQNALNAGVGTYPQPTNKQQDSATWTTVNTNARVDTDVKIEFGVAVTAGIGYITIQPPITTLGVSTTAATTIQVPSADVSVSGLSLLINPSQVSVFAESTTYTISFDAGVVEDGSSPPQVNNAFSVQFTTGDFTAPVLTSFSPANNAPAVDTSSNIVLTFSEAVQSNSGTGVLLTVRSEFQRAGQDTGSGTDSASPPCNDANIVISGNTVTIKLGAAYIYPLLPCEQYALAYQPQCFTDTSWSQNYVNALVQGTYDFWTSCITSYSPLRTNPATYGVPINSNIVLTFAEVIQAGTGNIELTPLGENPILFSVVGAKVTFNDKTVTLLGTAGPDYLCVGISDMQECKGKPMSLGIAAGVLERASTAQGGGPSPLPSALTEQLTGADYQFVMKAADLTPPTITIVSMYGISETTIRVTVRLDEAGTTYCRAYPTASFTPINQGGSNVPTLRDCDVPCVTFCTVCTSAIEETSGGATNYVGIGSFNSVKKFSEMEVDIESLTSKTFYWVYCFSNDVEIPYFNTVTSSQMLATQREVRTLDTTPPTFTSFQCVPNPANEYTITVTLSMNEAGRAYCKVVNKGFLKPSPNAVIAEGFFADSTASTSFTIDVDAITTGLGATGMQQLYRKTDYDVYCWAQDDQGYPYHGPNGMADVVPCPSLTVTTLDQSKPNMRFVMAESISKSQILITLQVDEGAKVWCAAWDTNPGLTPGNYISKIKGNDQTCMDNKGRQCGSFWVYDLDDIEDTNNPLDGVSALSDYEASTSWKYNQDVDIIVYNLIEEKDYPYIFCYAEDDETDGVGSAPNEMYYNAGAMSGPANVFTIAQGIGSIETLDESPPTFTTLQMQDPTQYNDRIIVTFAMNEAGTAYCRVHMSESSETILRINRILTANYGGEVTSGAQTAYITIDKLETRDTLSLYEATQYDVYCWAKDSAVDTQGQPRPNYQIQDYVDTPVNLVTPVTPQGGKTMNVWVKDLTPPEMIYVSSEALSQTTIQITLQLSEPGTVWCQPTLPTADGVNLDTAFITASNYKAKVTGIGQSGTTIFRQFVHQPYVNVDVEVDRLENRAGNAAIPLSKETPYNIFCFAEDDWAIEANNAAQHSINFNYMTNNVGGPREVLYSASENFMTRIGLVTTLDLTPPSISITGVASGEQTITVTLKLDESGTAWCQAVRRGFNVPTILEILDTNFFSVYTYDPGNTAATTQVQITGYDRPKNSDNSYITPLVLGTDYDVYCYADDDLCLGCKVTNGVSFPHVANTKEQIRTKDYTRPNMRYIAAESIARDQILITLQVDEGSRVWCAAWKTDPVLSLANYRSEIKNYAPKCQDNKGRQCGMFWVYDLDDLEDSTADQMSTQTEYDSDTAWKYNQDVDIILFGLDEETDYPYIYCYAEDDEDGGIGGANANYMTYDAAGNAGPDNVYTIGQAIGMVQTLDESPPTFTKLAMLDPTASNDRIVVTFQLNEAGTTYCRATLSNSGETTLRINQILSANFGEVQATDAPGTDGTIVIDKLESRDPNDRLLYEAQQYDVYCWAKDSAVDTQQLPRPNYMIQDYVDTPVTNIASPSGGKTRYVWVKDMTPPTMIYVSSEALTQSKIQITLQLNEPGTVWCQPAVPGPDGTYFDVADLTSGNYRTKIIGNSPFSEFVHTPYFNTDVEVETIDADSGGSTAALLKESPYNIFCFAEDDWKIQAINSVDQSINFAAGNVPAPSMGPGNGNEITFSTAENFKDAIGMITTLDLTPPSISIISHTTIEDQITITLRLDETGTAWCQAVRKGFNVPTILEILDTNFYNAFTYTGPAATTTVTLSGYDRPKNAYNSYVTPLVLGTDYDVYCYADDDLCLGCKVTNGVSSAHVAATLEQVRTKDYTRPNMRYVAAESIASDQILVTLQVDEGAKVWCAAWSSDPGLNAANMQSEIKGLQADCKDRWGNQCGDFWVYDLDDIEDQSPPPPITSHLADGVTTKAEYDAQNWKYNQDVDIIMHGLTEELAYPYIYCFAQDDEVPSNPMIYDTASNLGSYNVYSMHTEIGSVETLDETPPTFTKLAMEDPTNFNDRIIVTFQLNEAGTAYCRTTLSNSGETTLRINQILTANYFAVVASPSDTAYITIDKLESRDSQTLYEALQYDIYCWAKDSAVDTQNLPRPNYDIQDYVQTPVVSHLSPNGGKTSNVWIKDITAPTIIVVAREPLAEDTIQVTLQLNEPGTIWCQIADKDSSGITTTPGGYFCRDMDVAATPGGCYFEDWTKGVARGGAGSTEFKAEVHVPYQDYDIDLSYIEKVSATQAGISLTAQYHYHVWCFAEDDWAIQASTAPNPSSNFGAPSLPNKVDFFHAQTVRNTIGQVMTLDQTPPQWTSIAYTQYAETILTMTMTLDEAGTIWCMPVRSGFAEPSINEILQNNEYNTNCGSSTCVVTMQGLQSKTLYDIWCYTEDDNVYPQRPNGRKFTPVQKQTASTLDRTPPILTIVSAESPIKTDIRIKIKMEEPGTVWCNSFQTGTAYGTITFNHVIGGGFKSYVGMGGGYSPNGPINTNVEVVVTNLQEQTQYDTYCTAQDASTLPSVNKLLDATTVNTMPAIGQITTLDQSPPEFTTLGARGIDENTIQVTFRCNEDCRAYCRVTRSDSGENSLSINRILKADFKADWAVSSGADQTIDLPRLEDDSSLPLLERGTLYDTYCWARDEAVQHSCHAKAAGAVCETFPKPNFQGQVYVDTAFGGTPPTTKLSPNGGKVLHVRTPDTTPPTVIFIEAESTEETSITVTLQLDEPGTAYCKAYTTVQFASVALFNDLTSAATVYKNTVTNWNNIYKNFEVKVADLAKEQKYYVYCTAEDDELMEGATTITPQPTSNNAATPMLTEGTGRFTLDLTPPIITVTDIVSTAETTATVTLRLDEPGTAWCKAVRDRFDPPTINQIIAATFYSVTTLATTDFTVTVENLMRDTEYDVYCFARDRGTEVEFGVTPSAGNPGNDVTMSHVLTTKRDIHTLGDSTPPIIQSVLPVNGATAVPLKPVFEIVFNEDVQAGTGGTLHFQGNTLVSLPLSSANNGVCESGYAKMSIILNVFTADFSPCPNVLNNPTVAYTVYFAAGAFTDDSHNENAIAAFSYGWTTV